MEIIYCEFHTALFPHYHVNPGSVNSWGKTGQSEQNINSDDPQDH